MQHTMKLQPSPFERIVSGQKTVELRLYDEKRRQIRSGDTIRFIKTTPPYETGVSNWGVYKKSTNPKGNCCLGLEALNLKTAR